MCNFSRGREDLLDDFEAEIKMQKKLDKLKTRHNQMHGLRPTMKDDSQIAMANLQGGLNDDINFKRSLEIRNGIPLRSPTNFHKTTNAIKLHNYAVSGFALISN